MDTFSQLRPLLNTLTQSHPPASGEELLHAMKELDSLIDGNKDLPPRLRHFLAGRSYHKALHWLDENDNPSVDPGSS